MPEKLPLVVVVGGGFAGLAATKALRRAPVRILLIDRSNHHLFQPLLYQVAICTLSTSQIAAPIREILGAQQNATVVMGEVTGVDTEKKLVFVNSPDREGVPIHYDYLILATGATHNYFGHQEFAPHAPGLKSLADAVVVRNKILQAFEQAEAEEDPLAHRDLLTFVLVGGGPTGVEMAGALAIFVRQSLRRQFRRIDPTSARIVLIDAGSRVLGTFAEDLAAAAKRRLESLGVEVRLGHAVEHIDEDGVIVAGERITSKTVIWTAGVTPSPAGRWLKAETDRAGRVRIRPDLTVADHPDIFVLGDTASLDQDGKPLAGVAQVAMQQGHYAGRLIRRRVAGQSELPPFRYFDKGTMAVLGKGYAVLQSGAVHVKGLIAYLAWIWVHWMYLAQAGQRVSVSLQWAWTLVTGQRGSRLIVDYRAPARAPQKSATPVTAGTAH
ncbi:MAG: FAD-dependent oxidoreductase [Blastocatellia bacterium]|nr:MAG: FAD-dependent oxidoreductase [Blastocatellia bacterium]